MVSKLNKFKLLEKVATADIAFEAYGKSLEELFVNSAIATTSVMVDSGNLSASVKKSIILSKDSVEDLLFDFLNEIVFLKDAESLLFKVFDVKIADRKGRFFLDAELSGEELNPEKHDLKIDVKAVTLHLFKVEKKSSGYVATVVLDI